MVLGHFFPQLTDWLGEVPDPRRSGRAVFPLKALLLLGMLMFLSHTGSRNHFNDSVRDALEMARTLARLLGCPLQDVPHLDTLEKVLREVPAEALETLLSRLIRRLIRMKALDDWRVGGRFALAIDGTTLFSFRKRHCPHCLETRHESGVVTYSHRVLVAFLVNAEGYALPIACEFIENPGETYDKQDCEIKAFHRLEPKLRQLYPQIAFELLLDGLYADQSVLRACLRNGWNAAITFKESDMPALWPEAQALLALSPGQVRTIRLPQGEGSRQVRWINDLDYHGMKLSAVFQVDRDKDGSQRRSFAHLCARPIDHDSACRCAAVARLRWNCENEGFNVLKNGGFALEHVYSHHLVAAKGYLLLLLIAHLVQQLLTRGRLGAVFKAVFHTFRNYGKKLLAALLSEALPPDLDPPGQIRLSTS